jgi:hypothetical protein
MAQRGMQYLRTMTEEVERNAILDVATPPFLREQKATAGDGLDIPAADYSWERWLATASEEQLTNFAQWYTEQLKVLADPVKREQLVGGLKESFERRVEQAMTDGWIDRRHQDRLVKSMQELTVRFASPFGSLPEHLSGLTQETETGHLVVLPSVPGEELVTHELGHVFANITTADLREHFRDTLGPLKADLQPLSITEVWDLLTEGFDEHLTVALLSGAPQIVRPSERDAQGIPELAVTSEMYRRYREAYAEIVGGEDQAVTTADIRELVDGMADRNVPGLANYLRRKWPNQDMLARLLDMATDYSLDQLRGNHGEAQWTFADHVNRRVGLSSGSCIVNATHGTNC